MRLEYLKNHRKLTYLNLLTTEKLDEHLHEIEVAANDNIEIICKQIAEIEGVTEALKATDPMKWVGLINNIKASAEEVVLNELILC